MHGFKYSFRKFPVSFRQRASW